MKRSEILIVLALIGFGLIFQLLDSGKAPAGTHAAETLRRLSRGPVQRVEMAAISRSPSGRVIIMNRAGDMTFRNNETGALEILPTVECYQASPEKARKMAGQVKIRIRTRNDSTLVVETDIPERYDFKQLRVRLDIRLPRDYPLDIHSRYGIIEIDHLQNPCRIDLSRGDLEVVGTGSPVEIRHTHGRIELSEAVGTLDIHSSFSRLEVRRCRAIAVDGHHCRMRLEQVRGDVAISNRHAQVDLNDIQGNVNLQMADSPVFLSHVTAATLAVKNRYKPVQGRRLDVNALDAMVSHADLDLQFTRIAETLNVKANQAGMRLALPAGIDPLLHVQLRYGRIINRSALPLQVRKTRTLQQANTDGGSPVIVVDGHYSDLVLSRAPGASAD